ncbi:MAG: hypothetical protein ABIF85_06180 [Nanoarchaeota archaeon]
MVEKTISMKNEFDVKEKDAAEFTAALGGKAVYLDDEKKKYVLASKEELNKLVKDAYVKNDYIKANELLESAKNIFGKDIKKELREIVSKSMRLKLNVFLALLNEAYDSGISVSDVIRKNIANQLKENLKSIDTTPESKSLLEESLKLWADKQSIMHKEAYDDHLYFDDVFDFSTFKGVFEPLSFKLFDSQQPIRIFLDSLHKDRLSKSSLLNAIEIYHKHQFQEYLKSPEGFNFSEEQIQHIMSFFSGVDYIDDEVGYTIQKSDNKNADLVLMARINIIVLFDDVEQMLASIPDKNESKVNEGPAKLSEFNEIFSKSRDIFTSNEYYENHLSNDPINLFLGLTLRQSSNHDFFPQLVVADPNVDVLKLRYIEINNDVSTERNVLKKAFNADIANEESLKKKSEEYTNNGDYKKAQEMNCQLLYIDSCRKLTEFMLLALLKYLSESKVISITIPKGLLLWHNALGGETTLPELIKK